MVITVVIGKNSNLSKHLLEKIENCHLISSRELLLSMESLFQFKGKKINLIFNNFQPSTELNIINSFADYVTNSVLITSKVLDYFKDTDIQKVIYTSSSSVYGNNVFCGEKDELNPLNLHASLKVVNEKLIEKYCEVNSIDYTITRVFNMYDGDDKFSIISKIIDCYRSGNTLKIVNNGNSIRDFINIADVVDVYFDLIHTSNVNIVNIGTGIGTSVKSILDFLSTNDIQIKLENINRDELKTSTSNSTLLSQISKKESFIRVEDYLKKELKL